MPQKNARTCLRWLIVIDDGYDTTGALKRATQWFVGARSDAATALEHLVRSAEHAAYATHVAQVSSQLEHPGKKEIPLSDLELLVQGLGDGERFNICDDIGYPVENTPTRPLRPESEA